MNIKEQIGQRISIERKAKKLTQIELGELAGGLSQSRVNNWEKGIRTPGLEEVKRLASVLEVSPSYLMCFTDKKLDEEKNPFASLVPLLEGEQLCNPHMWISNLKNSQADAKNCFVPLTSEIANTAGINSFAIKMNDRSMEPELQINDILVIDPDRKPKPGNIVLAKHGKNDEIIIRRFKQLSASVELPKFELLAFNVHWPSIQNDEFTICEIVGTVINLIRKLV